MWLLKGKSGLSTETRFFGRRLVFLDGDPELQTSLRHFKRVSVQFHFVELRRNKLPQLELHCLSLAKHIQWGKHPWVGHTWVGFWVGSQDFVRTVRK